MGTSTIPPLVAWSQRIAPTIMEGDISSRAVRTLGYIAIIDTERIEWRPSTPAAAI